MTANDNFPGAPSDRRLRSAERLRTSSEIARVFARKISAADHALVVHLSDNGLSWSRLGVITPRRVGNAVRRNAVRRRIREAFRKNKGAMPKGFDIICVARAGAGEVSEKLEDSVLLLTAQAARKADRRRRG